MLECKSASKELGSSKRLKGIEEISEKFLAQVEAIHVDEGHKDIHN